jgi:hypothetical protein
LNERGQGISIHAQGKDAGAIENEKPVGDQDPK